MVFIAQMKSKVKKKFPFITLIKTAMVDRGWRSADLSRASDVHQSVLSRLFKGNDIKGHHLFQILLTLDLIRVPITEGSLPQDPKIKKMIRQIYHIMTSKNVKIAQDSLELSLGQIERAVKEKIKIVSFYQSLAENHEKKGKKKKKKKLTVINGR